MKKRFHLVLGFCVGVSFMPQVVSSQPAKSVQNDFSTLVANRQEQMQELLGKQNLFDFTAPASELDVALFVHSHTSDMLPRSWQSRSAQVAQAVIETANRHKMDPLLLMALISKESQFNPSARGQHGEIGLMQIKPSTARWLIDLGDVINHDGETLDHALLDPVTNIAFGTAYLARLRKTFKSRGPLYLAAYNMGAVNVKSKLRSGMRPRLYSDRVLAEYTSLTLELVSSGRKPKAVATLASTFAR